MRCVSRFTDNRGHGARRERYAQEAQGCQADASARDKEVGFGRAHAPPAGCQGSECGNPCQQENKTEAGADRQEEACLHGARQSCTAFSSDRRKSDGWTTSASDQPYRFDTYCNNSVIIVPWLIVMTRNVITKRVTLVSCSKKRKMLRWLLLLLLLLSLLGAAAAVTASAGLGWETLTASLAGELAGLAGLAGAGLPEARWRVSGRARVTRIPKTWMPRPTSMGSQMLADMSMELSGGAISSAASRQACSRKNAVVLQNVCERLSGAGRQARDGQRAEPAERLLTFVRSE